MTHATVFEENASVLPHWWAAGLRGATVICIDARLDLRFIAADRIARLRASEDAAAVARLQRPHPLSPCRDACFGSEDFLYAAGQLGVVRRVAWVAPAHVLRAADALDALRQMQGVTPQQIASFRRVAGGWIEGELAGIALAVLDLAQLGSLPLRGPVAIDMDIRYLVEAPQDRTWIAPGEVVARLQGRFGRTPELSVARSVGSGGVSLRWRFLADAVAALWEGRAEDAGYWTRLLAAERLRSPSEARVQALQALARERPACAAAWHALGLATSEAAACAQHLAQAAATDPAYGVDVLRELGFLRTRPQGVDLEGVQRLRRGLEAAQDTPARIGAAWVALGLHYAALDRIEEAVDCDERSLAHGDGHPDLALQIGRLLMASGGTRDALPWLERAAADDETRVAAWLHLSVCASRRGRVDEARHWAQVACDAAPAWQQAAQWRDSLAVRPG